MKSDMPHPLRGIPAEVHALFSDATSSDYYRTLVMEHACWGVLGDEHTIGYELESRGWEGAQGERFAPVVRWLCAIRAEHLAWREGLAAR